VCECGAPGTTSGVHLIGSIRTYHPNGNQDQGGTGDGSRVSFGRRARERAELHDLRDEVTRLRLEMRASLDDVREEFSERDTELARALRRVADACQVIAGRIEGERAERADLVDALGRIGASMAASLAQIGAVARPPRHTVLGGSIDATLDGVVEDEITLDEDVPPAASPATSAATDVLQHEAVEVHCRFGDRWVGGFEVAEVVSGEGGARYRLRRRSDGSILPTLFDERDIRFRVSLVGR
jgi:hypothetical protein